MMNMRSCSGFTDLKSGSIIVCHYAMGLSFMALILLTCRLHETDREVGYLQAILEDWFQPRPPPTPAADNPQKLPQTSSGEQVRMLQEELTQFYLPELKSSRTTLVLSVVFVGIYICSWWWMAFAIKQVSRGGSVSLRTVLLLAVFAAVDIAASTGFVLLRLIMYVRRDRFYPTALSPINTESEQIAAYTALRLITIKSSCGNADILVSVVVGFLTVLRVYSVVCVASFYKKAKSGSRDIFQKDITGSCDTSEKTESLKDLEDYNPKALIMDYATHSLKKANHTMQRDRSRRSSVVATSTMPDEDNAEIKIQASDMPMEMQRAALTAASQAIRIYSTEKHIAESIKQDFDQMYNPTWHCIVGRNWGSCVTHSKLCYIRLSYKDMTIMLYRST